MDRGVPDDAGKPGRLRVDMGRPSRTCCSRRAASGSAPCSPACSVARSLDATKKILGIPDEIEPVAFIPLGYPDKQRYGPTTRRPLSEVLHWEHWEEGKANSAKMPYRR